MEDDISEKIDTWFSKLLTFRNTEKRLVKIRDIEELKQRLTQNAEQDKSEIPYAYGYPELDNHSQEQMDGNEQGENPLISKSSPVREVKRESGSCLPPNPPSHTPDTNNQSVDLQEFSK